MNDLTSVRKINLEKLIKANFKSKSDFARHIGKSPAQVSNWFLKGKGKRAVSENSAREIESKLGLQPYFLDKDFSCMVEDVYTIDDENSSQEMGVFKKICSDFADFFPRVQSPVKGRDIPEDFLENEIIKIESLGCTVQKSPKNGSFIINGQIVFPDLSIGVGTTRESFYLDIHPDKKLKFVNVNPRNKSKEVLFVSEGDTIYLSELVKEHIEKYFQ